MNIDTIASRDYYRELYTEPEYYIESKTATHKLVISLIPLPWANWEALKGLFDKIISAVNPILTKFGWEALYCAIEGNSLVIYLREYGSLFPVALVIAAIAAVILSVGFLINNVTLHNISQDKVEIEKEQQDLKSEVTNAWMNGQISTQEFIKAMELLNAKDEAESIIQNQLSIRQIMTLINQILPLALIAGFVCILIKVFSALRGVFK